MTREGGRAALARTRGEPAATSTAAGPPSLGRARSIGTKELLEQLGITQRRVDYWYRKGYVRPAGALEGPGSRLRWSPLEVRVAELIALLTAAGLEVEVAARCARSIANSEKIRGRREVQRVQLWHGTKGRPAVLLEVEGIEVE